MILKDENGNPLPTAINLSAVGDGLAVFATDDNGVPLSCFWTLSFRGNGAGPSYFGTLEGFTSSLPFVKSITTGPSTSTVYTPPDQALYNTTVDAILTATPVSGPRERSIFINVQKVTPAL
jgi:hypothetical protein